MEVWSQPRVREREDPQPAAEPRGAGVLATTIFASVLAPSAGALNAELFPTSVRATAGGWLGASIVLGGVCGLALFGMVADALDGFAPAAASVAIPVILASAMYFLVPETKDEELQDTVAED